METKLFCKIIYSPRDKTVVHYEYCFKAGSTLEQVLIQCGILKEYPEINLTIQRVGVYGKLRKLDEPVMPGDRIEVYRPLQIDPKRARILRAKKVTAR